MSIYLKVSKLINSIKRLPWLSWRRLFVKYISMIKFFGFKLLPIIPSQRWNTCDGAMAARVRFSPPRVISLSKYASVKATMTYSMAGANDHFLFVSWGRRYLSTYWKIRIKIARKVGYIRQLESWHSHGCVSVSFSIVNYKHFLIYLQMNDKHVF